MLELSVLTVCRYEEQGDSLFSNWYIDGYWVCHGLENANYRIPVGSYLATKSWSPRFKNYYYELSNVPARKEILIHSANSPDQLEGCLAPGMELGNGKPFSVLRSREAQGIIYTETRDNPIIVSVIDMRDQADD